MLDVTERLVVIIGGGAVAARKAAGLLAAGAKRVRAVSPAFCDSLPAEVERIEALYEAHHLEGAGLIFAATDQVDVNDAVVRDARRRGIPASRADADHEEPGDFTIPAAIRELHLTISVSAGGSPALAARIRDSIRERLDPRWIQMAEAMQTLRPMILAAHMDALTRRAAIIDLASEEAFEILVAGETEALRQWIEKKYPQCCGTGVSPVSEIAQHGRDARATLNRNAL